MRGVSALALVISACGIVEPDPCERSVNVHVEFADGLPVFWWAPRCAAMSLMVMTDGDAGQPTWIVDQLDEGMLPPVTYGRLPRGAISQRAAAPLESGADYVLVLFSEGQRSLLVIAEHGFSAP